MSSVRVVAFRTDPAWEGADALLTDALCQALAECSGREWRVERYDVERTLPATRATKVDLRLLLDQRGLWDAGWLWLWLPGVLGAWEQYWLEPGRGVVLWPDVSVDAITPALVQRRLFVLALNTTRNLACALESFGHLAEQVWNDREGDTYRCWTGREPDPFDVYRLPLDAEVPRRDGGAGVVHVPPGQTRHYAWPMGHETFMRQWLTAAPREWWEDLA